MYHGCRVVKEIYHDGNLTSIFVRPIPPHRLRPWRLGSTYRKTAGPTEGDRLANVVSVGVIHAIPSREYLLAAIGPTGYRA